MTVKNNFWLDGACAGMDLSWIYAALSLIFAIGRQLVLPWPEITWIYGIAMLVTWLLHDRGWRIYQVLFIHLIGLSLAGLHLAFVFGRWTLPRDFFLSRQWLAGLLAFKTPLDWALLLMISTLAIVLWWMGSVLVSKPQSSEMVAVRFDKGVGILGLVVLLEATTRISNPLIHRAIFSFFSFGIPALVLSQNRDKTAKQFLPGARLTGITVFTGTVIVGGLLLVKFGTQLLAKIAQTGYQGLKTLLTPLSPYLINLLRTILGGFNHVQVNTTETTNPDPGPISKATSGLGKSWWWKIVLVGMALIAAVVAITFLVMILKWLWEKLKAPTKKGDRTPLGWNSFWTCWKRLYAILTVFWDQVIFHRGIIRKPDGATKYYHQLLTWGKFKGLSKLNFETPTEYGQRLAATYPGLEPEIGSITQSFNAQYYGAQAPNPQELILLKTAARKLRKFRWK